jgi:LDH2 family malate/lactate/ureidoglycolate dehydrogenase
MWGGAENLLGTNPIAFAIPAGEEPPVVLDIATTVVSYGTVKSYRLQGKPRPEGWMIDPKTGAPLTDPARSAEGLLLPIGGYKGAGLALVLGLLAGALNGAAFGRDVIDFNYNDTDLCDTGHFFIALDVARFLPADQFKREVDRHLRELRQSQCLPGVDAIRIPGAQRAARRADRLRNGVPVADEVMAQLDKLADELGVKKIAERLILGDASFKRSSG